FAPSVSWSPQQAQEIFLRYFGQSTGGLSAVLVSSTTTKQGLQADRYAQYFKGIKVEYSSFTVASKNNVVGYVSSNYYKAPGDASPSPSVSEREALKRALAIVQARKYMWQDPGHEAVLKKMTGNADTSFYPKGSLVWVEDMLATNADRQLHLAWVFNVYAMQLL